MILVLNGLFSFISCHLLVAARHRYASSYEIRSYADLAFAATGSEGHLFTAALLFTNQCMTLIAYILFFLQQLDSIMPVVLNHARASVMVALVFLLPVLLMLRSMKNMA